MENDQREQHTDEGGNGIVGTGPCSTDLTLCKNIEVR